MAPRKPKGEVSVESYRGFLRLRWRVNGQRYSINLGLPDDVINQQIATQKAHAIRLDILLDNFDPTLKKYRPDHIVLIIEQVKPYLASSYSSALSNTKLSRCSLALWISLLHDSLFMSRSVGPYWRRNFS